MARIDALPSIDIIRGLKGILDFYVWKGLPCVRAWPQYRPARQTDASLAAALLFGAVIKAFALTHPLVLEQLELEVASIPRTPRDVYVSGVFGNLHEASMSDFLDLLTECRDFLSNLTALLNALDSIDTDELVVNVDQSALPAGAATAAAQATQLTALQKLDDLQDALESKALDRFIVRGQDQLFSYGANLLSVRSAAISGANGYVDSASPGAGLVWAVKTLTSTDVTTATTRHAYMVFRAATNYHFGEDIRAFAADANGYWRGEVFLKTGDVVRVYFTGGLVADSCVVVLTGHTMTLET